MALPKNYPSMNGFKAMLTMTALLVMLAASSLFGQTGRANIGGTITDSQGAVIEGASVTAINEATGVSISGVSNGAGVYNIIQVIPGSYSIKVERVGFNAAQQSHFIIFAEQNVGLNYSLQPGKVEEKVTVTAAGQLVHTESAELGQTINAHAIVELPLDGRNPAELVFLTPGATNVINTGAGNGTGGGKIQQYTTFPTETGASINGGRQGSTYYLLDGAYNMDSYHLLAAPFPNPDATEEFTVIGNNFDPRYGFAPGGVVSIVTKSGTNNWHGNAFEFLRNYAVNAKEYFTGETDSIQRNQFGGSLGGPIKKDKLFVFANYQATRLRSQVLGSNTFVPSDAMRVGDFSALCGSGFDSNGLCRDRDPGDPSQVTGQIWHATDSPDYSEGDAVSNFYPNNFIDPSTFNSAAVSITNFLPHSTDPLGHLQAIGHYSANNFNETTLRTDYNLNDRQRISVRAFLNLFDQPAVTASLLTSDRSWVTNWHNYAGTWTWTINPQMVNSFTASYSRMFNHSDSGLRGDGQPICFSQYINVSDPSTSPCTIASLNVGGGPGGGFSFGQNHNSINRWTMGFSDSLSISKGKHLMVAGVDVLRQYWSEDTDWLALPIVDFFGGFNGNFTGYGFSDFLLGDMGDFTQGGGESNLLHQWLIAPYFADQIKVKSNLTVSLGMRWEPFFAPLPESGRIAVYAPGEQSTRYPNAPEGVLYPGDAGISKAGMPNSYGYFHPRVGIAWQPRSLPNTSIRAAFGMYATPVDYSQWNHIADTDPFSPTYFFLTGLPQNETTVTPIIPFSDPWSIFEPTGFTSPFPPFSTPNAAPGPGAAFSAPMFIQAGFARNYKSGVTQSWNLSLEHQFGSNWLLRMAYVGSESYHQSLPIDLNPGVFALGGNRPNSNFSSVLNNISAGTANYQSGQFTLEHRFSHGLQFQANYTYSHTIDLYSAASLAFNTSVDNPLCVPCNRGNSTLDTPHRFVANFIYETPSLKSWNASMRALLGGWQVSGIFQAQTGRAFQIFSGLDNSQTGSPGGPQDHASYAPGNSTIHVNPGSTTKYLTYADFTQPDPGSFGTVGRNNVFGPGINNWDLGFSKNFSFKENYRLQFRWEMFNALNRPTFAIPEHYLTEGPDTFGQIFSTESGFAPRTMQASLKFYF